MTNRSPSPSSSIETITPELAKAYLATMGLNRALSPAVVRRYARAMKDGEWQITHQGLAFDEAGALCDGQHRLQAVIRAGIAVRMMVTRGVSTRAGMVLDSGRARSVPDRLRVPGLAGANAHDIAATFNAMARIEDPHNAVILQPYEVERLIGTDGEHVQWALETMPGHKVWTAVIRAPLAYCRAFARAEVEELASLVVAQAGYESGSAAHAFVRCMMEGKLSPRGGTVARVAAMMRVVRLIRAHIEGERVSKVVGTLGALEWAWNQRVRAGVGLLVRVDG